MTCDRISPNPMSSGASPLIMLKQPSTSTHSFQVFLHKARSLDFGSLAYQLMQLNPQWTKTQMVEAIARYLAFLYLIDRYPRLQLVPSKEIDYIWHQHILDTQKYAEDCQNLFGRFVHHFPYLGMRGELDRHSWYRAYALTQVLFRRHFGEMQWVDATAADCEPLRSLNACHTVDAMVSSTADEQRPTVAVTVDEILATFSI